ncbi:DAK2 domain-containing protein [Clostridium guangxiense]|uniref:DAK2 domain-containing protein n=1 Tax=Clostridium guangxiense TaxID=1662055 RepID=UPI001E63F9A7|nr:DAK2 domain-containing protein [Clostridium guangxiense]MCD2346014.1 DAK2 domain-containing protein [Clostridium guangxiense]
MKHLTIDGHSFYNMIVNACNRLEEQKEFVNSLNVFPVPDGDTGTNMSMTFRNAVLEVNSAKTSPIGEMSKKLAKGALMGARGNSGVILSQILRGISSGIGDAEIIDSEKFSHCLMEGANFAYKAVMRPTEGTILTIVRSAGESALKSNKTDITELLEEVCEFSEEALNRTPEMLPVLKKAKVVDSGGTGLLIILKGMYEALRDDLNVELSGEIKSSKTVKTAGVNVDEEIKFGYCTEFIIHSNESDVTEFRNEISKIGDSMIVVNVDDITKVHIHTNDPGVVLSKAVKLGELSKIKIDNMREEHREVLGLKSEADNKESYDEVSTESQHKKYGFISVALGQGITKIFKDLGVDKVIEGGQTMNPSTQDILSSINEIDAENIIVFPNNKNIIMAANQAKDLSEKNVYVIPTTTMPQAITCLAEFDYDGEAQANIENLAEAIKNVKTGSVTYAVRDTEIDGNNIKENDILGLIEGKIKKIGNNVYEVCEDIIDSMIDDNSELISVYYGKDCDNGEVEKLVKKLEKKYSTKDVQCSFGEQPLYYFIVSVE